MHARTAQFTSRACINNVYYMYTYVCVKFEMALLTYFAKQKKTNIPEPNGALSSEVPSSAIVSANSKVQKIASLSKRVWFR